MRIVRGPAVLCFLAAAVAPSLIGQASRLNPTVKVLPKANAMVPTDCDAGLAPAPPRTAVAEMPAEEPVAARVAPPASDLRTSLRRAQVAAESGDYDSFKAALSSTRSAINAYPGGGEKQAAADVMQLYADLERLWDFSMTSPTGAFFDASSGDGAIVNSLRKYPEFPRAVADSTMTLGGQKIYPSRETRAFLVAEAARRLTRLGVRTPNRVVEEQPRPATHEAIATPKPAAHKPTKPATHEATATPKPSHRIMKPAVTPRPHVAHQTPKPPMETPKPHVATSAPVRHAATQTPVINPPVSASPKPAAKPTLVATAQPKPPVTRTEPAPVVTHTVAPAPVKLQPVVPQPVVPQPVTSKPVVETPVTPQPVAPQPAPLSSPTATTSAPTSNTIAPTPSVETSSSETETTVTTTGEKTAPTPAAGGMNLTFAIILIVVGIGVLIVLFRASD